MQLEKPIDALGYLRFDEHLLGLFGTDVLVDRRMVLEHANNGPLGAAEDGLQHPERAADPVALYQKVRLRKVHDRQLGLVLQNCLVEIHDLQVLP